ncbi:tRNA U34 5-methylaminomethyl-2-thiouridine-forming methyltransferase MnmC [Hydrobacter penzbergensis]|uniref:tRNA U34 5-methylaminomethyl-2-thiouridine-forming methyltransferase MnmC n=1 Tax=Hydrobacter penzbergensis TaxID=1235997 RepID=A0A8X8IDV7_9BACT|nr:tRNA (5-methylaminomethyl-2-thiouridine)(34)-methyltransferase MnmD [Hydrobacter penzbergensis]SDW62964.1 tRNA U34 5-methylaminomethyl-2-thiouridine-forming methyltransferase MnmC [Hydrobacter penzbergensis]
MQREIRLTADGSHTVAIPAMDVSYHSKHGAVSESMQVYIEAGLLTCMNGFASDPVCIFEMGFGTGLNALLSLREAINQRRNIFYLAIERYPLTTTEAALLNYGRITGLEDAFQFLHTAAWEKPVSINPFFTLHKTQAALQDFTTGYSFHCIYFDAFAPETQPELWTTGIFSQLFPLLLPGGCLVTYSSKSIVRKAMTAAGFRVEKIPGPHGKREMARAWKPQ